MAEPLKNFFGPSVVRRIAEMIAGVHPPFPSENFIRDALDGFDALELMPRGRRISAALRRHLPADYPAAVDVLVRSLGSTLGKTGDNGMAPFLYMPHAFFVAENGLDHLEPSLAAQYEITQRFTAEFSIRPFLMHHPEKTLARLRRWASDKNEHVRRLVSEGTRPRLPWAPRLPAFQKDPRPVLELLELLKDDPSLYVRRSVANNLNDIGKDHPDVLTRVARAWMKDASDERRWLVRHALRSAVKRCEPGALAALGYGAAATVDIRKILITPARAKKGETVSLSFDVHNVTSKAQGVLVDLRVFFVKANGGVSPKVFKMKELTLPARGVARVSKSISTAAMTTRRHFPGEHRVEAVLNGAARKLGAFHLV